MGADGTITIGLALIILGGLAGLWWRIDAKFGQASDARAALARDLADFKVKVSDERVSISSLKQTEERLVGAMNRLGDRIDRMNETLASH